MKLFSFVVAIMLLLATFTSLIEANGWGGGRYGGGGRWMMNRWGGGGGGGRWHGGGGGRWGGGGGRWNSYRPMHHGSKFRLSSSFFLPCARVAPSNNI